MSRSLSLLSICLLAPLVVVAPARAKSPAGTTAPKVKPITNPELQPELQGPSPALMKAVASGAVPIDYVLMGGYSGYGVLLWSQTENLGPGPRDRHDTNDHVCGERLEGMKDALQRRFQDAVARAERGGGMTCERQPVPRCHINDPTEGAGAVDFVFRTGHLNKLVAIVTRDEANVPKEPRERSWQAALAALQARSGGCHPRGQAEVLEGAACGERGRAVVPSQLTRTAQGWEAVVPAWGGGCATGPVWSLVYEPRTRPLRARLCHKPENDRCEMVVSGPVRFALDPALKITTANDLKLLDR